MLSTLEETKEELLNDQSRIKKWLRSKSKENKRKKSNE